MQTCKWFCKSKKAEYSNIQSFVFWVSTCLFNTNISRFHNFSVTISQIKYLQPMCCIKTFVNFFGCNASFALGRMTFNHALKGERLKTLVMIEDRNGNDILLRAFQLSHFVLSTNWRIANIWQIAPKYYYDFPFHLISSKSFHLIFMCKRNDVKTF